MRLLLTNDDGIQSPLLHQLAAMLHTEHDVMVVAPATDQSGISHAFTHGPNRLLLAQLIGGHSYPAYEVKGTPSDCVKLAIAALMENKMPELVISGINLGENAGVSAVYSGTVAGAREAALWGIPALAVSLSNPSPGHFDLAAKWLLAMLRDPSWRPNSGTLWNINFPDFPPESIQESEFTSMGLTMFRDHYQLEKSEHGIPGYKLEGWKPRDRFSAGSDDHALAAGRISITPLHIDQTNHSVLESLRAKSKTMAMPRFH